MLGNRPFICCKTIGDIANIKISCGEFEIEKKRIIKENIYYLATAYADEFKMKRHRGSVCQYQFNITEFKSTNLLQYFLRNSKLNTKGYFLKVEMLRV